MKQTLHRPVIISQSLVSRAMSDSSFFDTLPEFTSLRDVIKRSNVDISRGGCGGCKQRRVVANIYRDFISTANSLSEDGKQRLKDYIGASTIMINKVDPNTGHVQMRVL